MAFAATPPFDGTLAKYYVLPEDLCYKLPDHVSLEEGALLEPLAVAVHLVRQSSLAYGETIVVFGAGPVGLLCCAVARSFGARKVVAVDIQEQRLEFARRFAATSTFEPQKSLNAEDNAQELIMKNDLTDGADVVIDASGAEPSIQTGIHVLRRGGTFVQGGMGKEVVAFPITAACTKELHVRGSFRYASGDYQTALDMVASGRVKIADLISARFAFQDAEQAFKDVKAGKGIKTLIQGPS
jgi:D-xylulose reductase